MLDPVRVTYEVRSQQQWLEGCGLGGRDKQKDGEDWGIRRNHRIGERERN